MLENLLPSYTEGITGYPSKLMLIGQAGVGKTTLVDGLNVNGHTALHLDLQGGATAVSGYKIDVSKIQRDNNLPKYQVLGKVINAVRDKNKEHGGFYYDFLVIDPLTELQDIVIEHATKNFNDSPMGISFNRAAAVEKFGKEFTKTQLDSVICKDVRNIGQNGWNPIQQSFKTIMIELYSICPVTIILAHTKLKTLKRSELAPELVVKDIEFWPTVAAWLVSDVTDSGILNRTDNKVTASFVFVDGQERTKSRNFSEKTIVLSELVDDKIVTYMERLFPFLSEPKPKS